MLEWRPLSTCIGRRLERIKFMNNFGRKHYLDDQGGSSPLVRERLSSATIRLTRSVSERQAVILLILPKFPPLLHDL